MRNAKACWDCTHLQGSIANICHVHAVSQLCRGENAYDFVIYIMFLNHMLNTLSVTVKTNLAPSRVKIVPLCSISPKYCTHFCGLYHSALCYRLNAFLPN